MWNISETGGLGELAGLLLASVGRVFKRSPRVKHQKQVPEIPFSATTLLLEATSSTGWVE